MIISNNYLESRTTQRYWQNGMTYRDNQGDTYQNSHYMKGWSMTRDRNYAFSWSSATFLFDYEAIRRDFKVKPISWNYRIGSAKGNFDKEREEFLISNFVNQTFEEIKEEFFQIVDRIYEEDGY